MFDPQNLEGILELKDTDLLDLPTEEDDLYEYKSSLVGSKDSDLALKIPKAASGFWNSGGGLFIVGVDDQGKPDGGITLTKGRQKRCDWIDGILAKVSPHGPYIIHCIKDDGAGCNIEAGKAVFLIGFEISAAGPHMAQDGRYYIRSGARTTPANHFIVDAMYARRSLRSPLLRHVIRPKPGNNLIIQLGIVVLNNVPALDVSIEIENPPVWLSQSSSPKGFSITLPVVSEQFPLFFDVHYLTMDTDPKPVFNARVRYVDIAKNKYEQEISIDLNSQLGPSLGSDMGTTRIEKELKAINQSLSKSLGQIKGELSPLPQIKSEISKLSDVVKKKK